jgi:multimeric flavodoxin WrbA
MKVTAFVGSARRKHTYRAAERFLQGLQSYGDVDYEIVILSDYDLRACRGCKSCTDKGEELCPLKDDWDRLIETMMDSDGIVLATPNYFFQVSGIMKVFLDRIAFYGHRPRFFGKSFTSIVAQGVHGGGAIVKYLDFVGGTLGCKVVKGCCITTLEPMTEKGRRKIEATIAGQCRRFHSELQRKQVPHPSLLKLMIFRMSRSSIKEMLTEDHRDYTHYKREGWFDSDYYYPVRLSPVKKMVGCLFDTLAVRAARNR